MALVGLSTNAKLRHTQLLKKLDERRLSYGEQNNNAITSICNRSNSIKTVNYRVRRKLLRFA